MQTALSSCVKNFERSFRVAIYNWASRAANARGTRKLRPSTMTTWKRDPFATRKDRLIMTYNALIKARKQTGWWKGNGRESESDMKEKRKTTIDLARRNVVDLLRSTGSTEKKKKKKR